MFNSDEKISRKDFLLRSFGLIASLAVPGYLAKCAYYKDSSTFDTKNLPAGTPYISFELTFSDSMNRDSFKNALSIDPAIDDFSLYEPEWSADDTIVFCKYPLKNGGLSYNVTVDGSAVNTEGLFLDGNGDGTGNDPYTFTVPGKVT